MDPGRIVVIGDSHIGLGDGSETEVNAWLDRLAAQSPKALYLNGDLFHYLIAHPTFRTAAVDAVLNKFRELRARGIAVHYVEGNRDFFIKGSFVEEAVTDIADEFAVVAGDKKFLVTHGDLINDRDWTYRFWRRASKNPLTKLGVNLFPKKSARRLVDSAESYISNTNFEHKSRVPVERIQDYARRRAADGFTHVVLGHFHEKTVIPGERTVIVLPPWYETGEAMVIDPATGAFDFAVI
ncbi:MAG TPA: UDP-2,3-diacylglucosamine diphosphatase [Thermoanaerobaculia bacterium]|nr:UDP-2,3-diacylglucosamine diphosphatase [Thermoanaerobaculia bacterium]